jgi:prevent-host-death family protein
MESEVMGPGISGPEIKGPDTRGSDTRGSGIKGSGIGRPDIRWWQVQEAKQRFSEMLRAAESGEPQIVTRHGEEVAVLIDIAQYHHLQGQSVGFMDYLRSEPLLDADLEIERASDAPRTVDLLG